MLQILFDLFYQAEQAHLNFLCCSMYIFLLYCYQFSQKKPLSKNRSDYPAKDELINTFEAAFKNAAELYDKSSAEALSQQQKLGFFEAELPTVGDMATFLIISHTNLHLGQLSAWRRATGKAPLF